MPTERTALLMKHKDASIFGLHSGFLDSCDRFPNRMALEVDGAAHSYAGLRDRAAAIAATLQAHLPYGPGNLVGILANRSLPVYSGILGALMGGFAIVPLNPVLPVERTRQMIGLSGLRAIVVDAKGESQLDAILANADRPLTVLLPHTASTEALARRWPAHRFLGSDRIAAPSGWSPASAGPDSLACLFFTSGSTGVPKAVGVLHRNALRFVAMSVDRYRECGINETDRFSQFYDITFDSSMFDLYVSWALGACLCCPSASDWVNANKYVLQKELTVIDIVPSAGYAMNRANGWRPGRFPGLRLCRFGGEALTAELAAALAAAAPNAIIENVYGPTECTVDACYYRWDRVVSMGESEYGMVPIGFAGPQVETLIVDDQMLEVQEGEQGELVIGGPQVTPGYIYDPERTRAAFVEMPGHSGIYYRTGDLVRRPHPGQPIIFLGRSDHQIKIAGVRIELGEVEKAMRDAADAPVAVALGWPLTSNGAAGIVGFVAACGADARTIRERLKQTLPGVMVPQEIRMLDDFPLNANGKVDRKALLEVLKASTAAG